jgi:hypothetical protein
MVHEAIAANSVTVVSGSLTQGTVKASMNGNAYGRETNKINDWPLNTGGKWAVSFTNSNFSAETLIAFGDGGGITLKFDSAIKPVEGEKEFGIFTAQMFNASNGSYINGNMEAAILVSSDSQNWYTLGGSLVDSPLTYTTTSHKLNAPVVAYDFETTATAWTYGSPGAPSMDALTALTVANYEIPMPDDNLFNGTGTSAQRVALKNDTTTATYDTIFGSSGGGNWFDISGSGLSEVQYIRLNGVNCGGTSGGIRLDAVFSSANAVVPEPATIALLTIGVLGFIGKRRKV